MLTGPALDLIGFDVALGRELGMPLTRGEVAARVAGGGRARADEPARGRRRPVGRGGAEVKAVNLIPPDQRRGAGGLAGRTGGIVYVVVGGLAVIVALGVALRVRGQERRGPQGPARRR